MRLFISNFRALPFAPIFAFIMLLITAVVIAKPQPIDYMRYDAVIIDKLKRLSEIDSPKVILVGGSNLAFGIDSQKIYREFDMPVVNMGIHARYGLRNMLDQINGYVGKDDIVVVSPEYELLFTGVEGEGSYLLNSFFLSNKECRLNVSFNTFLEMLKGSFQFLRQRRKDCSRGVGDINEIYRRELFNSFGDFVGHLDKKNKKNEVGIIVSEEGISFSYKKALMLLSKFQFKTEGKGAKLYFIWPSLFEESFVENKEKLLPIVELLKSNFEKVILGAPTDFLFSRDEIYDTRYHLNKEGRARRTDKVVELLKSKLVTGNKNET